MSQDVRKSAPTSAASAASSNLVSRPHAYHGQHHNSRDRRDWPDSRRDGLRDHRQQLNYPERFARAQHTAQPQIAAPASTPLVASDHLVATLVDMGFSPLDATNALLIYENDVEAAAGWLATQALGAAPRTAPPRSRPHATAGNALKFKIGTSVQAELPTWGCPNDTSIVQSSAQPWIESMQAASASVAAAAKASRDRQAAAALPSTQPAAPSPSDTDGMQTVAARMKQQEASDREASALRTKQYLQTRVLSEEDESIAASMSSSDTFPAADSFDALADHQEFAHSKRELFAQLFDYDEIGEIEEPLDAAGAPSNPISEWLRMVSTNPIEALRIIQSVASGEAIEGVTLQELAAAVDRDGNNAVHLVCRHGHSDLLRALLRLRAPDYSSSTHTTAAQIALSDDSDDASASPSEDSPSSPRSPARFLFDTGALNHSRSSAVHICCRSEANTRVACLQLLLQRHALLDVKDARGNRSIHLAAARGDLECVQLLCDDDGSVVSRSSRRRCMPPGVRNKQSHTPMHLACMFGHLDVVRFLHRLDRAQVLAKDKSLNLPLHYAIGFPDLVTFLVHNDQPTLSVAEGPAAASRALMVNALNARHASPLALCFTLPRTLAAVNMRLLLAMDAAPNPLPGGAAGLPEVRQGRYDRARALNQQLLTKHSVGGTTSRHRQITAPLHEAASRGLEFAVRILVAEYGAPVDALTHPHRMTPLQLAARHGHVAVVRLLLHHGADPSRTDARGFNALLAAARYGHAAVVELIDGVDHAHTTTAGESALSLALAHGHSSTVRALLRQDSTAASVVTPCVVRIVDEQLQRATHTLDSRLAMRRALQPLLPSAVTGSSSQQTPPFADVILRCAQGEVIHAHRCVLAARSEFFRGMLARTASHPLESDNMHVLDLSHLPRRVVWLTLQYLYRGIVPRHLPGDELVALLLAANELLLPGLLRLCLRAAAGAGLASAEFLARVQQSGEMMPVTTLAQLRQLLAPHAHQHMQEVAEQQTEQALDRAALTSANDRIAQSTSVEQPHDVPTNEALEQDAATSSSDDEDESRSNSSETDDVNGGPEQLPSSLFDGLAAERPDDFVSESCSVLDRDLVRLVGSRDTFPDILLVANDAAPQSVANDEVFGLEEEDEANAESGIYAHRCILAMSSSWLEAQCALAASDPLASRDNTGALCVRVDISLAQLQSLLACIYGQSLCLEGAHEVVSTAAAASYSEENQGRSIHRCTPPIPTDELASLMHLGTRTLDRYSEAAAHLQQQLVRLLDIPSAPCRACGTAASPPSSYTYSYAALEPEPRPPVSLYALWPQLLPLVRAARSGGRAHALLFMHLARRLLLQLPGLDTPNDQARRAIHSDGEVAHTAGPLSPVDSRACLTILALDWSHLQTQVDNVPPHTLQAVTHACPCAL